MRLKLETIRMVDDTCLFCGLHGDIGGGHTFIGLRQIGGHLKSTTGWVCLEHQAHCAVQICPECQKKTIAAALLPPRMNKLRQREQVGE